MADQTDRASIDRLVGLLADALDLADELALDRVALQISHALELVRIEHENLTSG